MSVLSKKVWSPQSFLEVITGNCYIADGDDDVGFISCILEECGYGDLWDYPIFEIDHIVEQQCKVVLVDCLVWSEELGHYEHEYRWWEVPDDKIDNFIND